MIKSITPFLWFDNQAEDAMNFYVSVFPDSKVGNISRNGDGTIMTGTFTLQGQNFVVLNGGPEFKFNESVSFFVSVDTQEEIDQLWQKLTANGGEEGRCGWLKDRFGLSWQIIPTALSEALGSPDREKAERALQAMLKMNKIDIATLKAA